MFRRDVLAHVGLAVVLATTVVSCASGQGTEGSTDGASASEPPASSSPSVAVADFHRQWCGAVLRYAQVREPREHLRFDRRIVRQLNKAIEDLDALRFTLFEAGLEEAGERVLALADAIAAEARVLRLPRGTHFTPEQEAEILEELKGAVEAVQDELDPAIAVLGHC